MTTTEEAVQHHMACFDQGDLEGLLSDYTDNSILEVPQVQLKGLVKLRRAFSAMLKEFHKDSTIFEIDRMSFEGEFGYIFWHAQTDANDYHIGSDTFVVRDGKIVYQTFSAHIEPRK